MLGGESMSHHVLESGHFKTGFFRTLELNVCATCTVEAAVSVYILYRDFLP